MREQGRPRVPGLELLARGREADVYLHDDSTVLKLWREPDLEWRIDREEAAVTALQAAGVRVPEILGRVVVDGRPGLRLGRIDGPDLFTRLSRQPLAFLAAGRALGVAQAAMHEVTAPSALPELNAELRRRILQVQSLPEDLREAVLGLLDRLPKGDRLCHGDFHLGNMMGSWKAPVIIDWADACRGNPLADVARTDLIHRVGELPAETPSVIKAVAPIGRNGLVLRYLAAYARRRGIDRRQLEEWRIVRAAARLLEPIPSEHPGLIRYLRRRLER